MRSYYAPFALRISLLAFVLSLLLPGMVVAQNHTNPNIGQALEIAPPLNTLTADPGQTLTFQLSLRNISSGELIVRAEVNDFVAEGEDGTPKVILEDQDNNPYTLKDWLVPLPPMRMVPRQIQNLKVTIRVPANASPGGHYGVIRFTATPPELEGTGVALSASLGSLILVRVNGATTEKLEIKELSINRKGKAGGLFESTPLSFVERLENTGNTHVQPAGQVVITDMFGKKVAAMNVNLPPRNILPGSIRRFDQTLDSSVIGTKKLFGRYKATLKLTYGTSNETLTGSITFWVIPYRMIATVIAFLIMGFFVLRFGIKRYNQRVISKAQKSSKRK